MADETADRPQAPPARESDAISLSAEAAAGGDASGSEAADPAAAIAVNVKTLSGPDFEVAVTRDVLVSELKTKVREHTDVAETRQRLIYRGKVLADAEPLSTYKVESGHCVHMVARPPGVPSPASPGAAGAGAPTYAEAHANHGGDAVAMAAAAAAATGARAGNRLQAARGVRTLGERLLLGMGIPGFDGQGVAAAGGVGGIGGGGGGNGNGSGNGLATQADAALLNAAAELESGDFLSNMLGLGGGDNAQAPQGARAVWNTIEGRGGRAQGRDGGGRPVEAAAAAVGGQESGANEQADLEHVRQGLLTLHTLLSGTTSRRRAQGQSTGLREWPREEEMPHPQEPPAIDDGAADAPQAAFAEAENGATPAEAAPSAVAAAAAATATPGENEPVEEVVSDEERPDGMVSAAAPDSYPRAGSAATSSPERPLLLPASFDDGPENGDVEETVERGQKGEEEGGGGRGEENGDGGASRSSGSGSGDSSRRWLLSGRGSAGSGSVSASSEPPPHLFSSSGDSNGAESSDGWGTDSEERETRSERELRAFLRRSRMEFDVVNVDQEEEKEDGFGRGAACRDREVTRKFFVGQWLDVKDTVNNWLEATVMDMAESGTKLQIHYNGWPPRWDEWLSWDSPRIAPFRTRTQHLPHSQHVSPAPISSVRNAPITGMDDVRVVMPEVSRILREIGPMVDELSACYARNLEQDPSNSPTGERAVSNTLPWTRQRFQPPQAAEPGTGGSSPASSAPEADDGSPKAADLAGDIAPLLDRLGRMLTDVAPHLARLSGGAEGATASAPAAAASGAGGVAERELSEPGEVAWGGAAAAAAAAAAHRGSGGRRRDTHRRRDGRGGRRGRSASPVDSTTAFRQLVSTSSPAPTSSNINIHIHAIVPLRAPPSPPPPPPPPPTASASAVATPTRAERPPLAVVGSRNPPWGGNMDTVAGSASLITAAHAAAASRAAAASGRDSETPEGSTPRRLSGGILAEPTRSSGSERDAEGATPGGTASGAGLSRSASMGSSVSFDVSGVAASPLTVSTPGSSATIHSEPGPTPSSSVGSGVATGSDSGGGSAGDQAGADSGSGGQGGGGGQRRSGGWRGLLRALGVGGNGSSRVSGRRDGAEGD